MTDDAEVLEPCGDGAGGFSGLDHEGNGTRERDRHGD